MTATSTSSLYCKLASPGPSAEADQQRRRMQDRSQHDQGQIPRRDPKTLQHPERVSPPLFPCRELTTSFSSEEEEQIRKENEWAEE